MPDTILFKSGNEIINCYDAAGRKLQSDYYTGLLTLTPIAEGQVLNPENGYSDAAYSYSGTAYISNMEYSISKNKSPGEGGLGWVYIDVFTPQRMYNAEGYVDNISALISTFMTNGVLYNYYRRDHLGNNREVWNGVRKNYSGTVKGQAATRQRTQYYPSGLPWASNTIDYPSVQLHKYNDKEFIEMDGLDTYDYGARGYYPALGGFMTVDPLAEKYYSISPYAYCAGNPVNAIDLNGKEIYVTYDPDEIRDEFNELKARWGDNDGDQNSDKNQDQKQSEADFWQDATTGAKMGDLNFAENTIQQEGNSDQPDNGDTSLEDIKNDPPKHPEYESPKGGDRKVKNPNGNGSGWIDKKGRVWVPTDHGGSHAPHWDREEPGGGYENIYPYVRPTIEPNLRDRIGKLVGLTGVALTIYLIVSEGSRLFPPRNLIPVP